MMLRNKMRKSIIKKLFWKREIKNIKVHYFYFISLGINVNIFKQYTTKNVIIKIKVFLGYSEHSTYLFVYF